MPPNSQLTNRSTGIGKLGFCGRLVLLALIVLTPLLTNILAYHLFIELASPLALVAVLATVAAAYLTWQERERVWHLFRPV